MDKKLTLISPDAKNQISFILENGEIYYSTRRHYKANIKKSRIHLDMDEASSLGNFQLISNEESLHDEEWSPVLGQKEKINNRYRELEIELQNGKEYSSIKTIKLYFRAYDDGVAFRYEIPEQEA